MSWLKKVGTVIANVAGIAVGVGPLIGMAIPGRKDDAIIAHVTSDLQQIAGIIAQVEVFGQMLGTPGPDKLKASAPMVAQIIMASALLADHKIADPALFLKGCTGIAGGVADVLNSLEDKVPVSEKKA